MPGKLKSYKTRKHLGRCSTQARKVIVVTRGDLTDTSTKVDELLEQLVSRYTLDTPYQQVVGNPGAGGIGKMAVESLGDYLSEHKEELLASLNEGRYSPQPVRRVGIPKAKGKGR